MSRRTLLLVAGLIGLCWCGLAALGLVAGPSFAGRLNPAAPGFDQLRRRFTARLPASQMRLAPGAPAGCDLGSASLAAPESAACVYSIQPDARRVRRLSLALGGDGQSVRLALTQPGTLSVDQKLKAGEAIDLDVYQNDRGEGARLVIQECAVVTPEDEENSDRLFRCVLEIED